LNNSKSGDLHFAQRSRETTLRMGFEERMKEVKEKCYYSAGLCTVNQTNTFLLITF